MIWVTFPWSDTLFPQRNKSVMSYLPAMNVLVVSITDLLNYSIYIFFFVEQKKKSWVSRTSQGPKGEVKRGKER